MMLHSKLRPKVLDRKTSLATCRVLFSSTARNVSVGRGGVFHFSSQAYHPTRAVVVDLLRTINSKRQIEQYLSNFSSKGPQQLAVVAIGDDGVITEDLPTLSSALAFLRNVGLLPVVIHSAFAASGTTGLPSGASKSQEEQDVQNEQPDSPNNPRTRIRDANLQLTTALEDLGVRARPIDGGVFMGLERSVDDMTYSETLGAHAKVCREAVDAAIRAGCVPILSSLGETSDGQVLRMDVNVAATHLARTLRPLKVVFISGEKGDRDYKDGHQIAAIDSNSGEMTSRTVSEHAHTQAYGGPDWAEQSRRLSKGILRKVDALRELLDSLAHSSSVFFGNPTNLRNAVLADASVGQEQATWTVVRKAKSIQTATSLAGFNDLEDIKRVLRRHWKAEGVADVAASVEDFVESLGKGEFIAYFDEEPLENLAIVLLRQPMLSSRLEVREIRGQLPTPELMVFAISPSGWVNNVAEQLLSRIRRDHGRLSGSVKAEDENLEWWFEKAEGSLRCGGEVKFWYGGPDIVANGVADSEILDITI